MTQTGEAMQVEEQAERDRTALFRGFEDLLFRSEVRGDEARLRSLLHPEFVEFGASGAIYDREKIVDSLGLEAIVADGMPTYSLDELKAVALTPEVCLVTFVARRVLGDGVVLNSNRSSIWMRFEGGWRLRFHQGTVRPEGRVVP